MSARSKICLRIWLAKLPQVELICISSDILRRSQKFYFIFLVISLKLIMCHTYFSFQVLKNCSKDTSDWSLFSELAEKRQRHPLGNIELPFQIITHLESPNLADYGTPEGFQEFIYLSQITQAEELRTETEVYRRGMGKIDNETGAGKTMGALYWQLNDIWPGASWTSLDHGGR